jgi:exonuclease SbcD
VGFPDTLVPLFETENGVKLIRSEPGFIELALPNVKEPIRLILTPFANEIRLRTYLGEQENPQALAELLKTKWKDLAEANCDEKGINLLMTHLYFVPQTGEIEPESDDERSIAGLGGTQAIPTSVLPENIQYAALGHIHKFWKVASRPAPVVYSSSPLCYSLSEAGQEKFVVIIEADAGKPASFEKIGLKSGRMVHRKTFDSVDVALIWLDQNPDVWVELTIISDEYLNAEDTKRLYASHSGILDIVPQTRKETTPQSQDTEIIDIQMNKMDLFETFFKQKKGQAPSEELRVLFHEILNTN